MAEHNEGSFSFLSPGGNSDASELLHSVPQVASAIFGAVSSSILLLDTDVDELVFYSVSSPAERHLVGSRFPAERGIAGWVVNSGEPIIIDDVSHLEAFARDVAEATGHVPAAIMAAPLIHSGETLGVLEVIDPTPQSRSSLNELELLSLFASQAAISLHVLTSTISAATAGTVTRRDVASPTISSLTSHERAVGQRLLRVLDQLLAAN